MLPTPILKIIKAIKTIAKLSGIDFTDYDLGLGQSGLFPVLYVAEVVSNNDPQQEDKVQIFIDGIHNQSQRTMGPWARPFFVLGGGKGSGSSWVPEIGDKIWVTFQKPDILQEPYYFSSPQFATTKAQTAYNAVKSLIGGVKAGGGPKSVYPDMKFMMTPNKNMVGMSSSKTNSEMFIRHSSGTSFFIDKSGKVYVDSADSIFLTSKNPAVPVVQMGDGLFEVACVTENMVMTIFGLMPIQPTTDPKRVVNKAKL